MAEFKTMQGTSSTIGRKISYPPVIDEQLVQYILKEQQNGVIVQPDMIRQEAKKLIQPYCHDFKASTGWLDKFLSRNKISLHPSKDPLNYLSRERSEKVYQQQQQQAQQQQELEEKTSMDLEDDEDDEDDECDDRKDETVETEKNINPERLKAFNMFVRLFVDENLDRLVPISKQPKEKVNAIIMSCQRQFPEFGERARKRIRTYLKSCRRSTRLREPSTKLSMTHIPASQLTEVNNILAQACKNETTEAAKRHKVDSTRDEEMTEKSTNIKNTIQQLQNDSKNEKLSHKFAKAYPVHPSFIPSVGIGKEPVMKLSNSELASIRALITGYRQSASYLTRSADELEELLKNSLAYPDESIQIEPVSSLLQTPKFQTADNIGDLLLPNHVGGRKMSGIENDPENIRKRKHDEMTSIITDKLMANHQTNSPPETHLMQINTEPLQESKRTKVTENDKIHTTTQHQPVSIFSCTSTTTTTTTTTSTQGTTEKKISNSNTNSALDSPVINEPKAPIPLSTVTSSSITIPGNGPVREIVAISAGSVVATTNASGVATVASGSQKQSTPLETTSLPPPPLQKSIASANTSISSGDQNRMQQHDTMVEAVPSSSSIETSTTQHYRQQPLSSRILVTAPQNLATHLSQASAQHLQPLISRGATLQPLQPGTTTLVQIQPNPQQLQQHHPTRIALPQQNIIEIFNVKSPPSRIQATPIIAQPLNVVNNQSVNRPQQPQQPQQLKTLQPILPHTQTMLHPVSHSPQQTTPNQQQQQSRLHHKQPSSQPQQQQSQQHKMQQQQTPQFNNCNILRTSNNSGQQMYLIQSSVSQPQHSLQNRKQPQQQQTQPSLHSRQHQQQQSPHRQQHQQHQQPQSSPHSRQQQQQLQQSPHPRQQQTTSHQQSAAIFNFENPSQQQQQQQQQENAARHQQYMQHHHQQQQQQQQQRLSPHPSMNYHNNNSSPLGSPLVQARHLSPNGPPSSVGGSGGAQMNRNNQSTLSPTDYQQHHNMYDAR